MKYDKNILQNIHGISELIPKQLYKEKIMTVGDISVINQKLMGGGMSQNWLAIPWFEYYFDTHNFEYMVEIGSQKGSLSVYLANYVAVTEKMFFETYELFPQDTWYKREYEGCGHWYEKLAGVSPYINFFQEDIFSEPARKHITENVADFKTFIFCDGGDKAREFNMYAPLLKSGDCIAVHDWGKEIFWPEIQATLDKHNLVPDEPFATSAQELQTWIMPFVKR